jgi:hypothetical protein
LFFNISNIFSMLFCGFHCFLNPNFTDKGLVVLS